LIIVSPRAKTAHTVEQDDDEMLFPCVVCGDEAEAMICDRCWEDYKRVAGISDEEE
jgi:hypothetical protein